MSAQPVTGPSEEPDLSNLSLSPTGTTCGDEAPDPGTAHNALPVRVAGGCWCGG